MKRALITGASSGIGEATARLLASKGVNLVLAARREERLKKLKSELRNVDVKIHALDVRGDLSALEESLADVDVLINSAGLARGIDKLQDSDPARMDEMIDTNVRALLRVSRLVLPHMLRNGRGHVVNVGSVAGRWVYPGGAVYCATKFAVRAISEGLRMDLLGTDIRVTNIEPGMVETEFSEVRLADKERAKAVYKGMQPLSAQDIAESVVWSLERPAHVNIQEMVIFPTRQAAIGMVHRGVAAKPRAERLPKAP
ncbi:MAG TPA: SDR family NAD(P)-dependent oxidoreductase [Bdellovibrionales bacterium]|nr:SDR family NAD(P)-dependent oxidoreductase [Bdellovibrionales bacterium]